MNSSLRKLILALLIAVLIPVPVASQAGNGTVQGRVHGPGGPVAGVKIVLESAADSSFGKTTQTNAEGGFTLADIPLGEIEVKVYDAEGILLVSGKGILERAGETITLVLDTEPES